MSIVTKLKQLIKTKYHTSRDIKELNSVPQISCRINNLRFKSEGSIDQLFESGEIESIWCDSEKQMGIFNIPDGSGGVNPGDRKAIYYLISKFKPSSVLEVGTHIGASTLQIASALYMNQVRNGKNAHLTSVDIIDVNSTLTTPWLEFGTSHSPRDMINKLGYGPFVNFVAENSISYLSGCQQKFDFIFLDGSHSASTVYQEIPMALNLLNQNGLILLHDYFPEMKPLWSDCTVIPGPYLATERLAKEGANLMVLPLGKLPWPTKLSSRITSLALLVRKK